MKIGIIPINVGIDDPAVITRLARHAESVGLESVWTFEHVVVPVDYQSRYPYHSSGKMGAAAETVFADPLITLSHVAACTTTLKLGTGVNIVAQTNPVLLAKQVATLDWLSSGRFLFGAGVGWLREEFVAMGVPFERRGARFDDALVAMKKIWSGEVVTHQSDFLSLDGWKSHPRPKTRPHPPIFVGGTTDAALRRVARHGDGFIAPNAGVEALGEQLNRLFRIAEELGRDPSSLEITAMWPYVKERDRLSDYEALGVSRLLVPLTALGTPDPFAGVEALAEATR
jgi:probable F420-dependent oxidoreductase